MSEPDAGVGKLYPASVAADEYITVVTSRNHNVHASN
jgi:hypothetical protein